MGDGDYYTPDVIRSIRHDLWSCVGALANQELQRATWGLVDNPYYTYVEFSETFLDLIPDGLEKMVGRGILSPKESSILHRLYLAVDEYQAPNSDCYDHDAILGDPEWRTVVQTAKATVTELIEFIDPSELTRIFGSIRKI